MAYDIRFNVRQDGAETLDQISAKMTVMKERVRATSLEMSQAANRIASAEKQMADAVKDGHAAVADALAKALAKERAELDALIPKQREEKAVLNELKFQVEQLADASSRRMTPAVQAANAEFRIMSGTIPTRAIGQFITNVAGLGSIARGLFPVAGLVAFGAGVVTIGEKIYDLVAKWDAVAQAEKRAKDASTEYGKSVDAVKAKLETYREEEFTRLYGKSAGAANQATDLEKQAEDKDRQAAILQIALNEARGRLTSANAMPGGGGVADAFGGNQTFALKDAAVRQAKADVDTLIAQVSSLQNEAAVLRQEAHKRYVDSAVEGKQEETKGARPDVTLAKRIKESDVELQKQLEEAQGKELGGYAAIADKIQGIVDQKRAEGILDEKGLKILQQTEVALNKKYSQTLLDKVRKRDWRDIIKDAQGEDALERGEGKTSAYEFTRQLREDITQGEKDVAADRAARKSSADTQSFQINRSAQQVARRNRLLLAGGEIGGAQAAASNYAAQVSAAQRIFQIEKDRIGIIADEDVKKREMAAAERQNADALYQAELQYEQSIDELRERNIEKYRQAASDIFSALINRQEGPGRALGQLVRGAAIGQAGQIFGNLTSGLIGKAGNALASIIPPGSPLAKVFRGTAFDPANKDVATAQVETAQNTADTVAQLKNISNAIGAGSGGSGSGGGAASSVAGTVAAVAAGGGRLASISRAISGLSSGAGSVLSGNALATLLGYGTPGVNGNPGTDPSLTQRIGAGLGLAGTAAAGTFGIISGIHQGGAGGALTAAGSAAGLVGSAVKNISGVLGAVSPLLKAIPVVGSIAALALPLIGSFFGQGPVRRQNQLNQELSANQYIAPQALNVTEGPGGHFADFDSRGNLRTSSFSPYPTVRQGMVWEQTHGLFGPPPTYYNVPGAQTGQFGPSAPASSMTVNINAIDTQTGADFLMKNSHVIGAAGAKALQDAHAGFSAEVHRAANS